MKLSRKSEIPDSEILGTEALNVRTQEKPKGWAPDDDERAIIARFAKRWQARVVLRASGLGFRVPGLGISGLGFGV